MVRKKQPILYTVAEKKRGGKRRRFSELRFRSKDTAKAQARSMRKLFGDKYTYSVVKAPNRKR